MQEPDFHQTAAKFAKLLAFHCVRNSYLEDLHAGISPSSRTGDYTDVNVISPYGEIPWHQVGRISDEEMRRLMEDIVNRLYTFRSYWIPGSWDLRIVYTDAIPYLDPSQEPNRAGQDQESHR